MHIDPTEAAAVALLRRGVTGPLVMVNLLRFRALAEYDHAPELEPEHPLSGRDAYTRYEAAITPLLEASGGKVLFSGSGGAWLIGPEAERWDRVLLVRQASVETFFGFARTPEAQQAAAHRRAALEDSRLLPVVAG